MNDETVNESDSDRSEIRIKYYFLVSPRKDTPVKSNFEEIWISNVTINLSDTGVNVASGEHQTPIIHEMVKVIPFGVSGYQVHYGGVRNFRNHCELI